MAAPQLITMSESRRGALGGARYRDFEAGETYAVTEAAAEPNTVTPYLAEQFVKAGVAEPAEVAGVETGGGDDSKPLAEMTKAEMEAFANDKNISLEGAKTKADYIATIEAALAKGDEA